MNIVQVQKLDYVDRFLKSFISENTREAYKKDLNDYVSFASNSDLMDFSTLSTYRDHLITSSAPATVIRKFSAIKSFMTFLASEGLIRSNPAQNLKVPKVRTLEHTEAFDDAEVVKVINTADVYSFEGNMHRTVLVILFHLGLRRSELIELKISSFGEHRGQRFVSVRGKGDKQRLIPITAELWEEINAYLLRYENYTGQTLTANDFLIQSDKYSKNEKPTNCSTIYRIVKQYAKKAGVTKRVSPHSCRATLISHLLEKEISPRAVADLAGHSSIQTTVGIYDRKRDALTNSAASKVKYGC